MIEISINGAVMLYLLITLAVLLGLWMWHHKQTRHKKWLSAEESLTVCEFCHFAYLASATEKISRCPQCNSFNDS